MVNLLIRYLNEKLNCQYLYTIIEDENGNSADAIVLENSKLFTSHIEGHDLLTFDVEQLIDDRYTQNDGEIIVLDLNGAVKNINIMYLLETIQSKHISYSKRIVRYLEAFIEFIIKKKLQEKNQ